MSYSMSIDNRILYNSYDLDLLGSRFTINIPFICHRCGRCCGWGYPAEKMCENALPLIGYSNDENGKEQFMKEMYHKLRTTKPCIFYENNSCKIYSSRPKECRYYPLGRDERDPETNEALCPGRVRFNEIANNILQKYDGYRSLPYHKELNIIKIEYPPTDKQWQETLNNYYKSNPSDKEIMLFLKVNKRYVNI